MSDTLLLTKEEQRERREGGGGVKVAAVVVGGFLIEFPDNTEINLTPVKFDYISGAVLSCSPTVTPLFLSFFSSVPPCSLFRSLFLLFRANTIDPNHFE